MSMSSSAGTAAAVGTSRVVHTKLVGHVSELSIELLIVHGSYLITSHVEQTIASASVALLFKALLTLSP